MGIDSSFGAEFICSLGSVLTMFLNCFDRIYFWEKFLLFRILPRMLFATPVACPIAVRMSNEPKTYHVDGVGFTVTPNWELRQVQVNDSTYDAFSTERVLRSGGLGGLVVKVRELPSAEIQTTTVDFINGQFITRS